MAALNESNVERKLQAVSVTQDSIQSLSLWVIHHKAHHEKIVGIWLRVLKKSSTKHRLTMFYLCNDIVQTCKRKHAIVYKDAFKEILKEAVVHVRDSSIRPNIERIFKIWSERNVYDATFTDELGDIISNSTSRSVISRLLADFQPEQALEKIASYKKLEAITEAQKTTISSLRLDASSIEAVRQLKDRDKGREYSQQFEDGCVQLEQFLAHSEMEAKERTTLIELLEQSELFYDAQYSEAKIVANAYKNFGTRVSNLKKKLDEFMKTLPSPVPTPELDAPSPEQSPVYQPTDNTEAIDMEMSDSDNDAPALVEMHSESRKRKSSDKPSSGDFKSLTESHSESSFMNSKKSVQAETGLDRWQSAFKASKPSPHHSDSEPDEVNPISVVSQSVGRVSSLEIYNDREEGEGTPVKDELSSTPVQDEEEAEEEEPNPIEFLTQLINQSKSAGTASGNSSSFLQSLVSSVSAVQNTNGEMAKTEKPDLVLPDMEPPGTWAAWKAAQNLPLPPPQVSAMSLQPEYGQPVLSPQPVPPPQQLPYRQTPLPPPPPPPPPPHQQQSYDTNPPQPSPIAAYGPNHPPLMVPPPFPPSMQSVPAQPPQPSVQLPPQPLPTPNITAGPPPVPPQMMSHPPPHVPPPSHIMPMPLPPSIPNWSHAHSVGPQMPPPPTLPTNTNSMSPPVSGSYNMPMSHPPHPRSPIQQPLQPPPSLQSPPAQPMATNLRTRANSNLTEIQVTDDNQSEECGSTPSSPNISIVGGGRPVRPSFPPSPGIPHGPRPPTGPPTPTTPPSSHRLSVSDDQQEFIEKLKRKSSITSPTAAPVGIGATLSFLMQNKKPNTKNLRILTEVEPDEVSVGADQAELQTEPAAVETEKPETAPSEASSKSSADTANETASNNANPNDDHESTESDSPEQKPVHRIQSVASRVTRIETTADNRRFDKYNSNYDRRGDSYGDHPYQRDQPREHRDHYGGDRYGGLGGGGDRYGYDRAPREYYHQRDSYRSGGKQRGSNQSYDRRSGYYPRY